MSHTSKTVLGIAVAVLVVGGAYYLWQQKEETAKPGNSAEVTTLPSGSSTSNASMNQDLASIDAQLQAVNSDNASAAQSVKAAQ